MSSLIKEVDARTGLAGTNQMELLLFHVGTSEVFGINVFKVREVMKFPVLTRLPEADPRVEGMANIRGTTVPVIGLTKIIVGLTDPERSELSEGKLIVTEYNGSLQAFHVAGVDRILRLSWTQIKSPPPLVRNNTKGAVTAVAMLDDGRMVLILDVEKILAEMSPKSDEEVFAGLEVKLQHKVKRVLYADDSAVARTQIRKTLERLGIAYIQTPTCFPAWQPIQAVVVALSALARRNVVTVPESSTREYDSAPLIMAFSASSSNRSFVAFAGFSGCPLMSRALNRPVLDNSSLISRVAVAGKGIACAFSRWSLETCTPSAPFMPLTLET